MPNVSEDLLPNLSKKLERGIYLRRNLPEGGKLLVDRHLPFLCVYRFDPAGKDENIAHLVRGQASYLVISQALQDLWSPLVKNIAQNRLEMFEAFFLLEIWPSSEKETDENAARFKIFCPKSTAQSTVQEMKTGLEKVKNFLPEAEIITLPSSYRGPDTLPPLIQLETGKELGLLVLGLEIPPVYLHPTLEVNYPFLLQKIKRVITETIKKSVFEFIQVQTSTDFTHYLMLGGRGLEPTVQYVDKKLVQIDESVNFLLEVTPVNLDKAYEEFQQNGYEKKPRFNYRLISSNPDILKRELYQIPVERIEDVTLGYLLREKRNELDRQISMIETRNTPNFLYNSLQVYGKPDKKLHDTAKGLLSTLPDSGNAFEGNALDCYAFAEKSNKEISYLHQKNTLFHPKIEIRKDVSGLMVSRDRLLIGETVSIPENRVEALIQHEIGTHLLTYFNGSAQPLQLLKSGLAGYEELQEGLAVLSEYLVGGLNYARLRILAARVIAATAMTDGAGFIDTFRVLYQEYGFSSSTAFHVAARIYRGGGLTKDIVYLRGLVTLLSLLDENVKFEHLFSGKFGFKHVHYIDELMYREVVVSPPVLPKYLYLAPAKKKLTFIQKGATLFDLINTET